MPAESPFTAITSALGGLGGAFSNALVILVVIFIAAGAVGFYLSRRRGKQPTVCVFVIDPVRRRMGAVEATELATGIYRTEEGDIVMIPRGAAAYKHGDRECFPAIRYGKLTYIDPDKAFKVMLTLDGISEEITDAADLISTLYAKGRISSNVTLSPGTEIAFYIDTQKIAEKLAEAAEDELVHSAINGLLGLLDATRNITEVSAELAEQNIRKKRVEAETFERKMFTIGSIVIAVLMVLGIVLTMLMAAK